MLNWVYKSPLIKTIVGIVLPIIAGVLSGVLIIELTNTDGNIVWSLWHEAGSFYALVAICLIVGVYHYGAYSFEKNILLYMDDEYCEAYVRSQCLPEVSTGG